MKEYVRQIIIVLICISNVRGANILAIAHTNFYSHHLLMTELVRPLAEKGHNVTMVSLFPTKNPPKNWTDFIFDKEDETSEIDGKVFFQLGQLPIFKKDLVTIQLGRQYCSEFLSHPKFQKLLNMNQTFDIIVFEKFVNEALLGLSHHFKAPFIYLSTMGYSRWINGHVGNPASPAYIPDLYLNYSFNMSLWQRLHNTLIYCYAAVIEYFVGFPTQQKLYEQYFPNAPKLEQLYYNASLVLLNSHLSIKYAIPSAPNMIEIGGFHVNPPKKLSKDVQEFLDEATEGVILFSLGSACKSRFMENRTKEAIARVFSQFKQRVIWKFEDQPHFEIPSNLKLVNWLPQQDILAHKNVKLFITHGGLLSIIEAIYFAVPMLAMPIFAEQFMNAAEAEEYGYGLSLPLEQFEEENFKKLINELLTNTRFKTNIELRSKILHDQPMSPIEKAAFWIEYVIRYKGASHLQSVTLNLKWYQYILLDVILLGAIILFSFYFVFKLIFVIIFKFFISIFKNRSKSKIN